MDNVLWLPICVGLTGLGLVLSFLAWRRRGAAAGIRGVAWSLVPVAAYLLGAIQTLWGIGSSLVGFVTGFITGIINPLMWAGVALAGVSAVLFVVSGVMRKRGAPVTKAPKAAKAAPGEKAQAAAPQGKPAVEAPKQRTKDDDFGDIEEILKRRGIS
ncbi:cellulose synthase [Nonomuraea sp. NBC_01738]|uniref:cellulose synthase n=1 Tax=Nonomuraea sp. NBC_01738 TaxID=2976003 RepID=UPI002E13B7F0|nr:cellulose synthase [Nonomuraea sp. NBC_01738]